MSNDEGQWDILKVKRYSKTYKGRSPLMVVLHVFGYSKINGVHSADRPVPVHALPTVLMGPGKSSFTGWPLTTVNARADIKVRKVCILSIFLVFRYAPSGSVVSTLCGV